MQALRLHKTAKQKLAAAPLMAPAPPAGFSSSCVNAVLVPRGPRAARRRPAKLPVLPNALLESPGASAAAPGNIRDSNSGRVRFVLRLGSTREFEGKLAAELQSDGECALPLQRETPKFIMSTTRVVVVKRFFCFEAAEFRLGWHVCLLFCNQVHFHSGKEVG